MLEDAPPSLQSLPERCSILRRIRGACNLPGTCVQITHQRTRSTLTYIFNDTLRLGECGSYIWHAVGHLRQMLMQNLALT